MDETSDEMERVLEQLVSAGRRESAGFFTLDAVRALPKLGKHQLPHPSFYLLKWVQWAVAAGATQIRLSLGYQKAVLEHNGAPPPWETQELLGYAFRPLTADGQREPLHHLAVGAATALTLGPRVTLEAWDGAAGGRWVMEPDATHFQELARSDERAFCRLTLQRATRQPQLEEQLLQRFCPFCPASLWVNGSRVDRQLFGAPERPWLFRKVLDKILPSDETMSRLYRQVFRLTPASFTAGGELRSKLPWWFLIFHIEDYVLGSVHRNHHLLEARILDQLAGDRVGVPPDSRASLRETVSLAEAGSDCWALVAVEMSLEEQARVGFVRDGVLIPAVAPSLPLPGLVMAVSSQGLTTDASGFALVEDEALAATWTRLQGLLDGLAESLLQACRQQKIPLDWYVQPRLQGQYRENRLRRERARYSGF